MYYAQQMSADFAVNKKKLFHKQHLQTHSLPIARIYFVSSAKASGAICAGGGWLFRPFTIKDVCLAPTAAAARSTKRLCELGYKRRPQKPVVAP